MTISFPSNTKTVIDEIRTAIGREVTFIKEVETPCTASGCGLDPVSYTAINSFCTTCLGIGYTVVSGETNLTAHITWKPEGILNWAVAGQFYTGDCLLQIEYSSSNRSLVDDAKYVVVDDKRMKVESVIPRGVPSINRLLLECRLEEE